jgi:hypothetical protein
VVVIAGLIVWRVRRSREVDKERAEYDAKRGDV